ncbi:MULTISPECIES: hypothetical protein [Rhizobium/Agrobacterium group]|uniref:Zinc finger Ogr/Delta-type domain-containing protein n=1 Tax=Agrobacterium vitis TaxID=373 RepID=A0ABD6H8M4_AGRVI|nr:MULTISPECIES: hypothetical protein [Rhizobium/Agrobacterium group]MUO30027.1 hypothetical protein [Agrobacterium vitis]MUO42391.1 hypothetical protein [Agrobacterium vitis]MUP10695.1 hypothetical protein [Agrobacterium vitis]
MNHLYAKLKAEKTCPVCGADARPVNEQQERMLLVRFECSATFGVSGILNTINAIEPCPAPSQVGADHLMQKNAAPSLGRVVPSPYAPQVKSAEERRSTKAGAA